MISIRRILVPVDFSPPSRQAVAYAFALARQLQTTVILAHVVADSQSLLPSVPEMHALELALRDAAARDLPELIPPDFRQGGMAEPVVRIGEIDAVLMDLVREKSVDLVVMGTHGRRAPARWLMGSVTDRMLRKLPVPILTLSHVEPSPEGNRRILYATDLREDLVDGFHFAADLARITGAPLMVLHVADHWERFWGGVMTDYLRDQGNKLVKASRKRLADLIVREKPPGMEIESAFVEGHPYEKILETAQLHQRDLIVINLQSRSSGDRAFLGSNAERVVRLAHVPVLSLPISHGRHL